MRCAARSVTPTFTAASRRRIPGSAAIQRKTCAWFVRKVQRSIGDKSYELDYTNPIVRIAIHDTGFVRKNAVRVLRCIVWWTLVPKMDEEILRQDAVRVPGYGRFLALFGLIFLLLVLR